MGTLLRTLPESARKGIERRIADRRESRCEALEDRAGALHTFGYYKAAAMYYRKASRKAKLMGDRQREATLLLRESDSMADHGAKLLDEVVHKWPSKAKAKKLVESADSFLYALSITHGLGNQSSLKEERLMGNAVRSIESISSRHIKLARRTISNMMSMCAEWKIDYKLYSSRECGYGSAHQDA